MSPGTIRMALADTLDDLTADNFDRFRFWMLEYKGEPQSVRRVQVEGKTRLQVVDVLVSTFTEPGAVRVAVKLLRQIQCNQEAGQLVAETGGASSKPASSDTSRPSAGAPGVTAMAGEKLSGERFVDQHRVQLIDRVTDVGAVLDGLLDKGVVSQGIYDDIMAKATSSARMRKLYSGPLHSAGREGKEVFYQLLKKHESYLIKDLKRKK